MPDYGHRLEFGYFLSPDAGDTDQAIAGPPDRWAEVLTHFALDLGFGTFILTTPPEPDTLPAFIDEVAPQVRERVATERASAAAVPITGQR